jgi:hypothetical protein
MNFSVRLWQRSLPGFLRAYFLIVSASMLFSQSALAANAAPTISGTPATWVYVGSQYSFKPTAKDPEGRALSFVIANKPAWASFSKTTGQLSGTPSAVGLWNGIQIKVSDGTTTVAAKAFSIRAVSRSNVAPTISGSPPTTAKPGIAYSFKPTAKDANGDPLHYTITNCPSWAKFDSWTGVLSGTPAISNVGTYSGIAIRVSDGGKTADLPAFSIKVATTTVTNRAPTISGTPAKSATVGTSYSFRPAASDADGDALGFSIQNKPNWATFATSTGTLSGTPTSAATYSNIIISASDGKSSAKLPAFSISVTQSQSQSPSRSATLSWDAPTRNTDGSPLLNLAGYRIHYGTAAGVLTKSIQVANPGLTTYVVENVGTGTFYFAVKAYTTDGTESAASNVISKIVQ